MRRWTNENGIKMCEPDCVDEWLRSIWNIGVDYDGCNEVCSLKCLVDELVNMANEARECLWNNQLFGVYGSPNDTNEIEDIMIKASNQARLTKVQLLDTLFEEGVLAVYNLGLQHMYEYLKE